LFERKYERFGAAIALVSLRGPKLVYLTARPALGLGTRMRGKGPFTGFGGLIYCAPRFKSWYHDLKSSPPETQMKTYTVDPSNTPDDFVHFFNTLVAPVLTKEYTAYFLDICRIFMNALDDDEDYFVMRTNEHVLIKGEPEPGTKMVESLTGTDMSCAVYSKEFARLYLNNVDTRQTHDVVVGAMFPEYKKTRIAINPLPLQGIHQYSDVKWRIDPYNFTRGYQASNIKFVDILEDFEKMKVMKKAAEKAFLEEWGVSIDIRDYKYLKNITDEK